MFVTKTDDIWVIANFKETQLARIHRGENVTIDVDTFGRSYRGYVAHMPGASGDRFSLLPEGNATSTTIFLVIAVVAITIAIWWEWHHHDPVAELTLLRERNFALACVYYFVFAFGLFGSTVLIPERSRSGLLAGGSTSAS